LEPKLSQASDPWLRWREYPRLQLRPLPRWRPLPQWRPKREAKLQPLGRARPRPPCRWRRRPMPLLRRPSAELGQGCRRRRPAGPIRWRLSRQDPPPPPTHPPTTHTHLEGRIAAADDGCRRRAGFDVGKLLANRVTDALRCDRGGGDDRPRADTTHASLSNHVAVFVRPDGRGADALGPDLGAGDNRDRLGTLLGDRRTSKRGAARGASGGPRGDRGVGGRRAGACGSVSGRGRRQAASSRPSYRRCGFACAAIRRPCVSAGARTRCATGPRNRCSSR